MAVWHVWRNDTASATPHLHVTHFSVLSGGGGRGASHGRVRAVVLGGWGSMALVLPHEHDCVFIVKVYIYIILINVDP